MIAWAFGFGLAAAWVARLRDRSPVAWAVYGAILGPVALILLWVAPPGRCAVCRAPVRGWLSTCQWCGMDVRGGDRERPASTPVLEPQATPEPVSAVADAPEVPVAAAAAASGRRPTISVAPVNRPTTSDAPASGRRGGRSRPGPVTPAAVMSEPPPPAVPPDAPAPVPRVMRTVGGGVFLTGTVGLSAGSRYTIETDGLTLRVTGASDVARKGAGFERPIAEVDATGVEDRLILSAAGGRAGAVLVFMSVEGGPTAVAEAIRRAAETGIENGA